MDIRTDAIDIAEAAAIVGGMKALSELVGVTRSTLYAWLNNEMGYHVDWVHGVGPDGSEVNHMAINKVVKRIDLTK